MTGKSSTRHASTWRLVLSLQPGARVLEVSEDEGEQALALARAGVDVLCLRPEPEHAIRLRARGLVATDLDSWSERGGSYDAAVVSVRWSGVLRPRGGRMGLTSLLEHVTPSLRPAGSLALLQSNPLYSSAFLRWLPAHLGIGGRLESKGWRISDLGPVSHHRLREGLGRSGLTDVRVFAPLPDSVEPKFMLPMGERRIRNYFFTHLLPRPATARGRVLLGTAALLSRCGLFEWVVPARQATARKEAMV